VKAGRVDVYRIAQIDATGASLDEMQSDLLDPPQESKIRGTALRSRIAAMIIVHARIYRVVCIDVR